ncbi:hypothetical protein CCR75_008912 [Bremia lactucae]|uniref:Uncharacterized protein n=1 Tax=Bremia lactucae TaxID=4779 RepID=A0A976FRP8_BRELC|nr:hypothetical protein CCR75_008912 [Bremia lactucae]
MCLGSVKVNSMTACDHTGSKSVGKFVSFGSHPPLTRLITLWQGDQRWRPTRNAFKKCVALERETDGSRLQDRRMQAPRHLLVTSGCDLVD